MKRMGFFIVLMAMVLPKAYTQVTLGVKGGLNVSTITDNKFYPGSSQTKVKNVFNYLAGLHAGGYACYDFSSMFGLQAELLYSQMGYKVKVPVVNYGGKIISDVTGTARLHYLHVPLLLRFKMSDTGIFLEIGPQAGFLLGSKGSWSGSISDKGAELFSHGKIPANTFDFSAVAGLGYRMKNGLSLSTRYIHGFKTTDDDLIPGTSQNRAFQISLAYDIKTY